MRGKVHAVQSLAALHGITPAHAGKSWQISRQGRASSDHPRACGEKFQASVPPVHGTGSPPRMRGKGMKCHRKMENAGITPAHAGKSANPFSDCRVLQDHPRACGEKSPIRSAKICMRGSPPRMRGKAFLLIFLIVGCRITPAHAGKSQHVLRRLAQAVDHPRACGEKSTRARSKRPAPWITPAHAGKSRP